jgi:predicted DNA-binding ribbon-helix-helix protein
MTRVPERRSTTIVKHSLLIAGHSTSVSLEEAFWIALKQAARDRALSLASLVAEIDAARGEASLSSAIRVFLLDVASRAETVESVSSAASGPP